MGTADYKQVTKPDKKPATESKLTPAQLKGRSRRIRKMFMPKSVKVAMGADNNPIKSYG